MNAQDQLYIVKLAMLQAGLQGAKALGGSLLKGMSAPVQKVFGLGQKAVGRVQQGAGVATNNPALLQQGTDLVAKGVARRAENGLRNGLGAVNKATGQANTLMDRVGRGVGMAAVGAPLAMAPFKIPELMGANSVDPTAVKEHAMASAQNRVNSHMQSLTDMPFMQRIQTALNPESFSQGILNNSQQFSDLYNNLSTGKPLNNPGIMSYLGSMNPFLGIDPVKQKVRYEMMNSMNKGAMEKEALMGALGTGAKLGWQGLKGKFMQGAGNLAAKIPSLAAKGENMFFKGMQHSDDAAKGLKNFTSKAPSLGQQYAAKGIHGAIMNPGKTALGLGGAALTPYFMASSYGAGQRSVYNNAQSDAEGMADYQFANEYSQPGFMGTLKRLGGAIMPETAQSYVNNKTYQTLHPQEQQQEQSQYTQQQPAGRSGVRWNGLPSFSSIFGAARIGSAILGGAPTTNSIGR